MFDLENTNYDNNKNVDVTTEVAYRKEGISNDNTNKEADSVYGVIYVPGENGPEYVSKHYNISDISDKNLAESKTDITKQSKKNSLRRALALTAVVLAFTVLISSSSAILAAYLTKDYYENTIGLEGLEEIVPIPNEPKPNNNHVSVDKTPPSYQIQNKEPGKLMSMEQAIETVKDSVVEITTERVQSGFGSFSQYIVSGAGSGVIISSGGYMITNHHVIEGASNIIVRLTSGKEYTANLIASDSQTDVAIISITPDEEDSLTSAVIGSSENLRLGQTVIAIGNPLGKLGGTVSDGIISCLAREIAMEGSGTMSLLQTNAAVSPGNSGGGLFDLYGRLIGVVNAKSTGEGVEGISFAIPIDTAWDVAGQLIDKGYVSGRPSLGVEINQVNMGGSIFGLSYSVVVVTDENENSDFRVNDIVLGIDDIEIATLADVSEILAGKKIGDKVTVTVRRENKLVEVEVELIEYVPEGIEESQTN